MRPKPLHAFIAVMAVSASLGTSWAANTPLAAPVAHRAPLAALGPLAGLSGPLPWPVAESPTPTPWATPTAPPTASPRATPTPAPTPNPCRAEGDSRADLERRLRCAWPGDDNKAVAVVDCESDFQQSAHSPGGKYHSFWQFDLPTYRGNGGSGDPHDHSIEEQTRVAWTTFQRRGWQPWECA